MTLLGLALLLTACTTASPSAAPTTSAAPSTSAATTTLPPTTAPSTTTTRPAPRTTTTTLPPGIEQRAIAVPAPSATLRYDGVAPEALTIVEETIPTAREALGDSGPLVVHVYASADNYVASHDARQQEKARADVNAGAIATGGAGVIRIYAPRFLERDKETRRLILFHEYFHTVQSLLSGGRSNNAPLWFREGSARYVEFGVAGDYGYTDYARRRSIEVRVSRGLESLQSYEDRGGPSFQGDTGGAYVVGFLASEYLENLKGRQAVQRDFWAALKTSTDWRAAFATVFGVSVDQFYADFEAYRKTL